MEDMWKWVFVCVSPVSSKLTTTSCMSLDFSFSRSPGSMGSHVAQGRTEYLSLFLALPF